MSEIINNSQMRKEMLKHVILQIHEGHQAEELKPRLMELMQKIPYGEVVEVEQELISGGLPVEEVQKLCDVHSKVLEGHIDLSAMPLVPPGHPVDTFQKENRELEMAVARIDGILIKLKKSPNPEQLPKDILSLRALYNSLLDVDKHYSRKENLLFPFLEKNGITGPPKVMWGKDDEVRTAIKNAVEVLRSCEDVEPEEFNTVVQMFLKPAASAVIDMITKEEQILLPMSLDRLTEQEWYEIYQQTNEIGYCLYDPKVEWKPSGVIVNEETTKDGDIHLPSGSFTNEELLAILNTLPVDMTFVDRNDKVKYFSQGKERIFDRNRAILKRDVRACHPPSSVGIVDKIVDDFKTGKEESAPFWINLHGEKFIHIEYFALRNEKGEYLGTLEVSQNLTNLRNLEGEQRLLSYKSK
ncbi:MAG: DUF438 domain-containing protein [Candidatus Kapabacteria bacterium]|nr:DUF438 domain-containing protein [Candidatus Kapabacteria bacterium]